ncbi:13819_t:CDS:2 [Rhizophagus irregularis]|nr:13819_t:CDS:2 [Rhizophagus irregularis]
MPPLEDQRGSDNNKFEDFNNLNKVFSNRIKEVNRNQDELTDKSKVREPDDTKILRIINAHGA